MTSGRSAGVARRRGTTRGPYTVLALFGEQGCAKGGYGSVGQSTFAGAIIESGWSVKAARGW